MTDTATSETRTRFLREIAARIPVERIVEVHLFPPMRQGGLESGVAVLAMRPEPTLIAAVGAVAVVGAAAEGVAAEGVAAEGMAAEGVAAESVASAPPARHTVFTATYRLTLKGPDRGKWEVSVVAEAEAPLVTVDAVVRGVQRRSGETAELDRVTAEELAALVRNEEPACASTTR